MNKTLLCSEGQKIGRKRQRREDVNQKGRKANENKMSTKKRERRQMKRREKQHIEKKGQNPPNTDREKKRQVRKGQETREGISDEKDVM